MENPELNYIQRRIVTDAKRNLYAAFLSIQQQNLSDADLALMAVLVKDPDIQNILDKAFNRNKN